jgi:hypothetical protein
MFIQIGMVDVFNDVPDGLLYVSKVDADADIVQFTALYKNLNSPVMSVHMPAVAIITGERMGG